jgi:hypothetical protein
MFHFQQERRKLLQNIPTPTKNHLAKNIPGTTKMHQFAYPLAPIIPKLKIDQSHHVKILQKVQRNLTEIPTTKYK